MSERVKKKKGKQLTRRRHVGGGYRVQHCDGQQRDGDEGDGTAESHCYGDDCGVKAVGCSTGTTGPGLYWTVRRVTA